MIGLEEFIKYSKGIENIFFDISPAALVSTHRIYKAINHFGADSVILGSDTPFAIDVAKVLTAKVVPNLKDGHVANNRFVI
jgi:CMP-N-acetylneuraminic acid synthetase